MEFPTVSIGAANPSAGLTSTNHQKNFGEFLAALDEKRRPAVDGYEARKAVAIILAIYEAARSGQTVELAPPAAPRGL
jgi:predicted dehydrogenase